ncbi:MAG TPA: galactokinase [Chitinophagaceae bacterium]|nr:galactokinase [Chitinophagaceae bacterium]
MENNTIIKEFSDRYGSNPEHIFFCPGRVNLIGEHIDYNGGRVLPCAISSGTWLAISKNRDKKIRFQCLNFPEMASLHLQESYSKAGSQWFNYPLGIIHEFIQHSYPLSGLDMLYDGNLPIGAGLSSSASIEVLTAFALNEMFAINLSLKDIVILSKKVENEFIGVNCGIMDQFAVAFGKKNNAILLNCDTLEFKYTPLESGAYSLVIINTRKERGLVGSKYNERFTECSLALTALKKELPANNLCEVTLHEFSAYRHLINDRVLEKRALHVISENFRVGEAVDALNTGQLFTFGKLMYASHQSLKEFYEVSCIELDTIVDFCKSFEGCIGARMTGAGFGGCAIALVEQNKNTGFSEKLTAYYEKIIGIKPEIYQCKAEDGVKSVF